jgi:hypothetical protein
MWTIIIVVCLIGAVIGYFALKEGAPRDSAAGIVGSGMGCLVALKLIFPILFVIALVMAMCS